MRSPSDCDPCLNTHESVFDRRISGLSLGKPLFLAERWSFFLLFLDFCSSSMYAVKSMSSGDGSPRDLNVRVLVLKPGAKKRVNGLDRVLTEDAKELLVSL